MRCCSLFLFLMTAALVAADEAPRWRQLASLPDPLGVAGALAGVSDGALLVAGGANFPGKMPWDGGQKAWHDRVWVLEQPESSWLEAGKLPHPLAYGVSVSWRDAMICAGGSDQDRHYAETFRLRWKNRKLEVEPLPALPMALSAASGAMVGDVLYVAGGAEEPGERSATNRAWALDLAAANPAWLELPPIPGRARILSTGAAHDGAFYVLGGAALEPGVSGKVARVYLREAWKLQPGGGWQRLADLPAPRVAAASPAPVIDGRILLIAGDDGTHTDFRPPDKHPGFPPSILAYDPAADRWSEAGQTPAPRATAPTAKWHRLFIVPSGEVRPGIRSPEVWSIAAD